MIIQIAVICDSAYEYNGRLCILGTFNAIETDSFPVKKSSCSYVTQIKWNKGETGLHKLRLEFTNENGEKTLKNMEVIVKVEIPEEKKLVITNSIINFQNLKFNQAGDYFANIYIDDQLKGNIELQVIEKKK